MGRKSTKVTLQEVREALPVAPKGYHYSVEQVSPLLQRVWLHHERPYVYAEGEPVRTVYCFVKSGRVHAPKNFKTPRPQSVCMLIDLAKQSPYTTIVPTCTDLTHLS